MQTLTNCKTNSNTRGLIFLQCLENLVQAGVSRSGLQRPPDNHKEIQTISPCCSMMVIQVWTAQIRFIQLHGHEKGSKISVACLQGLLNPEI